MTARNPWITITNESTPPSTPEENRCRTMGSGERFPPQWLPHSTSGFRGFGDYSDELESMYWRR